VAVSPDGAKVFVANFLANTITTFEAGVPLSLSSSSSGFSQKGLSQKIDIPTETIAILGWEGIWSLQFDPSFHIQLIAVNRTSDNVGILDVTTNQATATVPVGTDPEQSAFDTELPQALVTNLGSNELAIVDTNDTTTAFVPVGEAPVDVVFTVQAAQVPKGSLENPQPGSFQSGVGVISGFVCDATPIEIGFDGGPLFEAAYGTSRGDTQTLCGDTDNGFSLLFNWNLLGNGVHTVRALADGVEFANVTITVTTLGQEFATGLSGEFTLQDFPQNGTETSIQWQQSQQNFSIVDVQ
jgi:YVTN family beta-propeller protein